MTSIRNNQLRHVANAPNNRAQPTRIFPVERSTETSHLYPRRRELTKMSVYSTFTQKIANIPLWKVVAPVCAIVGLALVASGATLSATGFGIPVAIPIFVIGLLLAFLVAGLIMRHS